MRTEGERKLFVMDTVSECHESVACSRHVRHQAIQARETDELKLNIEWIGE